MVLVDRVPRVNERTRPRLGLLDLLYVEGLMLCHPFFTGKPQGPRVEHTRGAHKYKLRVLLG